MMKAYILQLGVAGIDSIKLVQYATLGTRSNKNPRHEWLEIPIWSVLVDHPQKKIIYDLGCIPNAMEDGWTFKQQESLPWGHAPEETMEGQLALVGLKPNDIDIVVASHLHVDHFGNIGLFCNADVYVPKEDWIAGLVAVHQTNDPQNHKGYIKACMQAPVRQYHPIAQGEDFELCPGVEVLTLPGHAPNLLAIVLHLEKEGTIIFPSDAVYNPTIYGPPARMAGICHDNSQFMESIEKVRRIQEKYRAKLFYSHHMEQYQELKKAPDYYS